MNKPLMDMKNLEQAKAGFHGAWNFYEIWSDLWILLTNQPIFSKWQLHTYLVMFQLGPRDIQNSVSLDERQFCSKSIAWVVSKGTTTALAFSGLYQIKHM